MLFKAYARIHLGNNLADNIAVITENVIAIAGKYSGQLTIYPLRRNK